MLSLFQFKICRECINIVIYLFLLAIPFSKISVTLRKHFKAQSFKVVLSQFYTVLGRTNVWNCF